MRPSAGVIRPPPRIINHEECFRNAELLNEDVIHHLLFVVLRNAVIARDKNARRKSCMVKGSGDREPIPKRIRRRSVRTQPRSKYDHNTWSISIVYACINGRLPALQNDHGKKKREKNHDRSKQTKD